MSSQDEPAAPGRLVRPESQFCERGEEREATPPPAPLVGQGRKSARRPAALWPVSRRCHGADRRSPASAGDLLRSDALRRGSETRRPERRWGRRRVETYSPAAQGPHDFLSRRCRAGLRGRLAEASTLPISTAVEYGTFRIDPNRKRGRGQYVANSAFDSRRVALRAPRSAAASGRRTADAGGGEAVRDETAFFGRGSEMAGIPRTLFLQRLGDYGVPTFDMSEDEFQRETRLV